MPRRAGLGVFKGVPQRAAAVHRSFTAVPAPAFRILPGRTAVARRHMINLVCAHNLRSF